MNSGARWWFGLLMSTIITAADAGTESLSDHLRRCSRESDETRRLACFDALVTELPRIEADEFGLTGPIAHKRDPSRPINGETGVLTGKIADLRQTPRGEWIFTLDNGQHWIQAEARASSQYLIGESVTIEHGAMGSLWLAADHQPKTRVKRIR
jgi:hypothetical protein